VRSIGDLSNQLWKLGKVTVPADFKATVLFKISHPNTTSAVPLNAHGQPQTKKYVLGIIFVVLSIITIFLGPLSFRNHKQAEMPVKSTLTEVEPEERRTEPTLEKKSLAALPAIVRTSNATPLLMGEGMLPTALEGTISTEAKPIATAEHQTVHWHLQYSPETDHRTEMEKRKQGLAELQTLLSKAEKLKTEIKRLGGEKQLNLGQSYSSEEKKDQIVNQVKQDAVLNALVDQMRQLEAEIKRIGDENDRIETEWRKEASEKKRKESLITGKIRDTLVVLDVKFQYQDEGLIVFTTPAGKLDRILENILPLFQEVGDFQDFGDKSSSPPNQEQLVSLYIDQSHVAGLHWHISYIAPSQKSKLFDVIRELGGSLDYESEEMAVFLVPKTMVKNLNMRRQAMRIDVVPFGILETDTSLSNAPIKISINFSK
jgi:hypothetical protein